MTSTPQENETTLASHLERDDPVDEAIRVLHVDDEPDFAELAARFLERADERFVVDTETGAEAGLAALADRSYDCVVSDYDMPGMDGLAFLEAVREDRPELPFILFTGKGSEEVASEAISAGVTDYLQKESGTTQYAVLANRVANVVERSRTRRALAESHERLAQFFEHSPLGTIEWDESLTVTRVNPAAEAILGYDADELVGSSWERLVPDDERGAATDVIESLHRGEAVDPFVIENVRADGSRVVCEWHAQVVTDDDGEVATIFSKFQDVTERERREAAREAREARFRAIAESASDAIVTIDADSVVRYANPAVERIFGYPPEELLGEPLTRLMPEEIRARHLAGLERYLETGERTMDWTGVELPGRHRDGRELDLEVSFAPLEAEDDRHYFTGIIRDVTDEDDQAT